MNVARTIAAFLTGATLCVLALMAVEAFLVRFMPDTTNEEDA